MAVWGFIFVLVAAVLFGAAAWLTKSLVALGLCVLAVGIIFTFATTSNPVHF